MPLSGQRHGRDVERLLCQLSAGDHMVIAKAAFGPTRWVTDNLLPRFGIEVTAGRRARPQSVEDAIRDNTKLFSLKPRPIRRWIWSILPKCRRLPMRAAFAWWWTMPLPASLAAAAGSRRRCGGLCRDQADGRFGRTLAGAVAGDANFINTVLHPYTRNTGNVLSPFNAWVVLKGLETLELRAKAQSDAALELGRWLEARLPRVLHPRESHPQHYLVKKQMYGAGSIFSFEVDGGREAAMKLLNALQLIDISNNIGDTKSLMTHPASTHSSISPETRAAMGVTEGMVASASVWKISKISRKTSTAP
jgi:cystathionine gamma-synthase/O-succinylhomoserine sulfhydrylase